MPHRYIGIDHMIVIHFSSSTLTTLIITTVRHKTSLVFALSRQSNRKI